MTTRFSSRLRLLAEANACTPHAELPLIMGICNVTPDSFSDGGEASTLEHARQRVDQLLAEGADVIDIGAESTRPGAEPVTTAEQLARALPIVRYAAARALVSIDTADPEVAAQCLGAGARIVNDVSCLRDPRLATVAAEHDACFVLMHSRGTPRDMSDLTHYDDILAELASEWQAAAERAIHAGLAAERLVFDPGLGFGKQAEQSLQVLCELPKLRQRIAAPLLVGASRKSFLRLIDPQSTPKERLGASIAAALEAWRGGASCVRVHDVRATKQALALCALTQRPPALRPADRGAVAHA